MSHDVPVEPYLSRIGFDQDVAVDLSTLGALQRAHMTAVPFENLDVVARTPMRTDLDWSINKIVTERRGGWCFEVNGAFASLLRALGFDVRLLGAAVLLDGPNRVIDHLSLEVTLDQPYLVDVGFGDSFINPLELNTAGPQDGGSGTFEFIASSEGTTLTRHDSDGVPEPSYRFKRVDRDLDDFSPASDHLWTDPTLHWQHKPFATRLIDGGPDRITLLKDRLKIEVDGITTQTPVAASDWRTALVTNFGLEVNANLVV